MPIAAKRYFVVHLAPGERRGAGLAFEVQILNGYNESILEAYFEGSEGETIVDGRYVIPAEVIRAATRQSEGKGDYVDAQGRSVPPF